MKLSCLAQRLHQVAEQQGRDPKSIGLAFYAGWFDEATRLSTPGGERHILTGTAAEIAEDIDGLAAQGAPTSCSIFSAPPSSSRFPACSTSATRSGR